jgi:uncharacterized protein (DUF1800 family)
MTDTLYLSDHDVSPEDVLEKPVRTSPQSSIAFAAPAIGLLAASCGGGGAASPTSPPQQSAQALKPKSDAEAARFILQASLSVSEAEISNIKSIGFDPWLTAQIDAPVTQTGVAWLSSRGYDRVTAENYFDNEYPGDYMAWNQLMSAENGVRKRVALALSEFFVVSLTGLDFIGAARRSRSTGIS